MARLTFHPGDTVLLQFRLPFSIQDVKAVVISFRGNDRVAFEALATAFSSEDEYEMDEEGNYVLDEDGEQIVSQYRTRVGYTLTQAESLMFDENSSYLLQLNVFGPNSSRIASKEVVVKTMAQHLIGVGYGSNAIDYNESANNKSSSEESEDGSHISYNDLLDRPKINSVTLEGNRLLPESRITDDEIDELIT